jgi:DNA-directed RNA polymerase subunit N
MIIPVRCFTCGRVIAADYEQWVERTAKGENAAKALDGLGVTRYCCRRMILSHADLLKDSAHFE